MYDAVNRGFRLARGEIVSHLNCDEQLLPDTLHFVRRFFESILRSMSCSGTFSPLGLMAA